MPLEKIAEDRPPCRHREHDPPRYIVLDPGLYRYTCPQCGHVTVFRVTRPVHYSGKAVA